MYLKKELLQCGGRGSLGASRGGDRRRRQQVRRRPARRQEWQTARAAREQTQLWVCPVRCPPSLPLVSLDGGLEVVGVGQLHALAFQGVKIFGVPGKSVMIFNDIMDEKTFPLTVFLV